MEEAVPLHTDTGTLSTSGRVDAITDWSIGEAEASGRAYPLYGFSRVGLFKWVPRD